LITIIFLEVYIFNNEIKNILRKQCLSIFVVTNMCSADGYISNFIYLDVHNASLYYLQSCTCTLHVRFPGTLYFVPIRTPDSDCGSVIRVISYDGNQIHSFQCGGTATFPVKPDDRINITVHSLGGGVYDTAYCYVISLGRRLLPFFQGLLGIRV
jgi:hypothetical protein